MKNTGPATPVFGGNLVEEWAEQSSLVDGAPFPKKGNAWATLGMGWQKAWEKWRRGFGLYRGLPPKVKVIAVGAIKEVELNSLSWSLYRYKVGRSPMDQPFGLLPLDKEMLDLLSNPPPPTPAQVPKSTEVYSALWSLFIHLNNPLK